MGKYFRAAFAALLLAPSSAAAGYYVIPAAADTYVKEAAPLETHGSDVELSTKLRSGDNLQSLFRFDVSSVPAGERVVNAIAVFHVTLPSNEPVEVYRVTNAWAEATASWNSIGDRYDAAACYGAFVPDAAGPIAVDVTALVQKWVDGDENNWGLVFVSVANDKESRYASRESPFAGQEPVLYVRSTGLPAMHVATGTYLGNGALVRPVTGVTFRPDLVLVKGNDNVATVARTGTMLGDASKELGAGSALLSNNILSLDADGFTVGSDANVNQAGIQYSWAAFRAAPGEMVIGSYLGDGVDDRDVLGLGFEPDHLIVMAESGEKAMHRFAGMTGDASEEFEKSDPKTDRIQALLPDGFQIGSHKTVNDAKVTYHYVAWNAAPGLIASDSYNGNGNDNRNITAPGFQPDFVFVTVESNAHEAVERMASMTGDVSFRVNTGTVRTDLIQALLPGGFQVGTSEGVNANSETYYWTAFRDHEITDADLSLGVTADDSLPNENDTVNLSLTLANFGPVDATAVEVSGPLPTGLTYVGYSSTQGTYDKATGIWSVGDVANGGAAGLVITATVDPGTAGSTLVYEAKVTASNQTDSDESNNTATTSVRVQAVDLEVAKTVDISFPNEGDSVIYQVVLTNGGPDSANAVEVADALPPGLTYVSATATHGAYEDGTGRWSVGTLAVGDSARLTLGASLDAGTGGATITNTAVLVAADQADTDASNDTASVDVVVQSADVGLRKTVNDPTPVETDLISFTLRLFNSGPDDATGLEVTDFVPAGLTYAGHTSSWGTYDDATGVWDVGTVLPGDTVTLTVDVTVDVGTRGWTISNLAAVTASDQADPDAVDNSAFAKLTVQASDFRVATGTYTGNGALTRSITGLGFQPDALIVQGDDGQPPAVKSASMSGTDSKELGFQRPMYSNIIASLDADGFTVGPDGWMNSNGDHYHWVAFQTAPGYMVVGSYTGDGGNNRAVGGLGFAPAYVVVLPDWDNEACQRFPSQVGDASITFGYGAERPNLISAFVPGGFEVGTDSLVNAPGIDYHYMAWSQTAGVSRGGIHTGNGSDNFDVTGVGFEPQWLVFKSTDAGNSMVHRPASLTGDLTLSADLGTTFADGIQALLPDGFQLGTNSGVNEASRSYDWMAFRGPEVAESDLEVALTASDTVPIEGDTLAYSITVRNAGPDGASGVQLFDLLPAGLTYLFDTPSQGLYAPASGLWDIGVVLAGDSATLDILAAVNLGTVDQTIANTATVVASNQADPDTTNNLASISVDVGPSEMRVVSGSYTGDGTGGRTITGVGFRPDVVIIKGDTLETAVVRTATVATDGTKPLGTNNGLLPNLIESLDDDGFTVGASARVNRAGVAYYWTAFRAARPELVVGSYAGDGANDRLIPTGFRPEYAIVFDEVSEPAVQRFSEQVGDVSLLFSSENPVSNRIKGFASDGFLLGTDPETNRAGDVYHYMAWRAVDGRSEGGMYVGDGSDDRDVQGTFNPSFLLVQRSEIGSGGFFRTSALSGDNAFPVTAGSLVDDHIQAFHPDGFQIGTAAGVNNDTDTYYWISFKDEQFVDLAVSNAVDEPSPNEGDVIEFTVSVANNGPADASGVELRDVLPPGLDYESDAPLLGSYNASTGIWHVGSLAAGSGTVLQLRARVGAGTAGSTIVNTASLWLLDQIDTDAANNTGLASITVRSADLAVAVSVDESFPAVGDTVTYSIHLSNGGPDDAVLVTVADTLPSGVTYLYDTAGGGAYDTTNGVWSVDSLAAGDADTLMVSVRVDAGTEGSYLTYAASVAGSAVADPDSSNNTDSVTLLVPTPVTLDDDPASLFPASAFVGAPDLALRIGVDNPGGVGVTLDTTSVVSFTDGIRIYAAQLANRTYVPALANGFVLAFEPNLVPAAFVADSAYDLSLSLEGTTDEARPFFELLATAGTNSIFIDQPKMSVDAPIIGDRTAHPGQSTVSLLALHFDNHYSADRTLDSLVVTNASSGPGTPAQLDALIERLELYADVDGSLSITAPDTLLAAGGFSDGRAALSTDGSWVVPALGNGAVIVTADVDSTAARDGDLIDAWITSDADIAFAEPTVFDTDISPLYPLNSYGTSAIDGMMAHQVTVAAAAEDTLYSGTTDVLVLAAVFPQNGYEPDTLMALSVKDYSGGFDPADFDRLALYRDDGDGLFDPALDPALGTLIFSGDRFDISGLSSPTGPNETYFVAIDVDVAAANGNMFRPGIPTGGVTVVSNNDGPLDAAVVSGTTFTLVRVEKLDVSASPLASTSPARPGDRDVALLAFEVRNNTLGTVTVDSLRLANVSAGPGTQSELDGEFDGVHVYVDDGNGKVDTWDTAVAHDVPFVDGSLTTGFLGLSLDPGDPVHLLVACDVDSACARDSDGLGVGLPSAGDLFLDGAFPVFGSFPVETDPAHPVNGMMAFQIDVQPSSDSTAITETTDILVLDLGVPGNGYAPDTLRSIHVENLGSADDRFIETVNLWADGGDGRFDAGDGDDTWLNTLVSLGARHYQRSGLSHPLTQTCSATNRLYVSCDLRADYKFSATVQFSVPVMGIGVASGNDGPIDVPVIDPSVGVIPRPDEITVFPYAVGDKRVYPGSKNVLNYGIGLYNGFGNAITLDEISLLLSGSADHADIDIVRAFADSDTNGLFNPLIDQEIATATSKDLSYRLEKLELRLPSEKITYLFVAYDLGLGVSDSVVVDFYVPTASELSFIPAVDTNLSGEFTDSPGKDITDGMIAAQITLDEAPADRAAPDDPAVLAMGLTIPANGSLPDQLNRLTVVNVGSAVAGQDIDHLDLWIEDGGDPDDFDPAEDRVAATLEWNGVGWRNTAPMGESIATDGLKCYVTFAAAATAGDDRTFQARLPVGGVDVSSGNDGPLDSLITNPNLQTISTDPLITTLSTDRGSYSTGQQILLTMRVRNEGVDTLFAVTAPAPVLSGSGSASFVDGPTPAAADLAPGADTTLAWRYTAVGAGDLQFRGFAHNGDSTEVSLKTDSPPVEIQDKPSYISASLGDVSPISVNRGQNNVPAIVLDLVYDTFTGQSAPVEFTGIEIAVENAGGTPVAPNSVLGEITIVGSTGSNQPFALADSASNPLHLYLDDPILVSPGDSVRLDLGMDIAGGAALAPFRLSIQSQAAVGVVDANDGAAVTLSSGAVFPWPTSAIDVNVAADSLLVTAPPAGYLSVNNGQEHVEVFRFTLLNNGATQAASEVLSRVVLTFQDTTGAAIAPNDVIRNLALSSAGLDLFFTDAVPSTGDELVCDLSGVLLLPPQSPREVTVTVDLRGMPQHDGFYVSFAAPTSIMARDYNDGRFVTVAPQPPGAFPIESSRLYFQPPASGLTAACSSLVPGDILPSTAGIPLMDLVYTHADSLASSIEVDSLAMAFVDRSGNPLYPGNYFSQLSVVHGADTLAALTSLSSSNHIAEARLVPPVTLDPSMAETIRIYLSSKDAYTPAEFQVRVDREHVVAHDANTGQRITAVSGTFPMFSDAARLQLVGDAVSCGLVSEIPPNVTGREEGLTVFDLIVRNDNPPGYTPSVLRSLTVHARNWGGVALDPSGLLAGATIRRGDSLLATGTVGSADVVFDLPAGAVVVAPGSTDTLVVAVDLDASGGETFRFVIADAGDTDVRDAVTDGPITTETIGDTGFPLATAFTHVLGASQSEAFTNYPNPFAAGRQSTRITFYLDEPSRVTLKLYTLWGAPVKTLLDGEQMQPGLHQDVTWTGLNGDGDVVNNGVYYLVLDVEAAGKSTRTIKRKVGVVR